MDGIFSLPYSEYEAIAQIQKHFKKKDGISVFIPTSRQQKGIDFILLNTLNSRVVRVQVKASRSWISSNPKKKRYTLLFNNFHDDTLQEWQTSMFFSVSTRSTPQTTR